MGSSRRVSRIRRRWTFASFGLLITGTLGASPAAAFDPTDPEYLAQEGLAVINAGAAYALGITGDGITVAIVDSGIFAGHIEFDGALLLPGFNAVDGSTDVTDNDGHGTHVAGIIGARINGVGMHGVAPGATLLPIKLFDGDPPPGSAQADIEAQFNDIGAAGYRQAIARGAAIINGSIGLNEEDPPEGWARRTMVDLTAGEFAAIFPDILEAAREVAEAGVIAVFTTGNEEEENADVLAGLPYLFPELEGTWLAVGSVDHDGTPTDYSSACGLAATWCLWAPGGGDDEYEDGIYSAYHLWDSYVRMEGTSMAAPHVSGAAALVMERFPDLTPQQIVELLLVTATDMGEAGVDPVYGHGLLNVERAMEGPAIAHGDVLLVDAGANGIMRYTLSFSGDGAVTKTGGGTAILAGTNTYIGPTLVDAGTLVVNGSITNSTTTVDTGGTLAGAGTVGSVTLSGGTIAPGNSIGTLKIDGDIDFSGGGTYEVEVNATGQSDRIEATGTATLAGGSVRIVPLPGGYGLSTDYTIIEAGGGLVGSFGAVESTLAFLTPTLTQDANSVFLNLERNDVAFTAAGSNRNQRAIGTALDALAGAGGGGVIEIIDNLLMLTGDGASEALESLSGAGHGNSGSLAMGASQQFKGVVFDRLGGGGPSLADANAILTAFDGEQWGHQLASAYATAISDADPVPPSGGSKVHGVWLRGFGGFGSIDATTEAQGTNFHSGGVVAGVDTALDERMIVGAAFAYARTKARTGSDRQEMGSFQLAAYGRWSDGDVHVDGALGGSLHRIDSRRHVTVGGFRRTAEAAHDARDVTAKLEAGRRLALGHATTLTPFAGLEYTHLRSNGFTERGAGAANLTIDRTTQDSLRSDVGFRLGRAFEVAGGVEVETTVEAAWVRENLDDGASIDTAFAQAPGARFQVSGSSLDRNRARLGVGAVARLDTALDLDARYRSEYAGSDRAHGFAATLRWRF